jgi:outer membrane protein assembly factor BamB
MRRRTIITSFALAISIALQFIPVGQKSDALENWCHWPSSRKNPDCTAFCASECGPRGRELSLMWSFESVGQIMSTPIFADFRVYFGGEDGRIHCVNSETGKEYWNFQAKSDISTTPLFVENRIFFGSDDHFFYAIDSDGNKLWDFKSIDKFRSSPTYWNKRVIAGAVDGWIYCWNVENGEVIWKVETQGPVNGTPCVYQDVVYCGSDDMNLYAIDALSGRVLWKFKTLKEIDTAPACFQDRLYVGSDTMYCLDPKTGRKYWSANVKGIGVSSPAVIGTTVVFGSTERILYCYRSNDGKKIWEYEVDGGCGSPVICGDRVYACTNAGSVYAVDLVTANLIWTEKLGGGINYPPSVADGKIYVGCSDTFVYCFGDTLSENCVETKEGAVDFGAINLRETAQFLLTLKNCGLTEQKIKISPRDQWFDVSVNEIKLKPARETIVQIYTIPNQIIAPGTKRGRIQLSWDGGSFNVVVRAYVKPEVYFPSCDHAVFRYGNSRTGVATDSCGPVEPKLKENWKFQTLGPIASTPCVIGNKMYFGSWDNRVYCLDTETGKMKWQFDAFGDVDSTPTYFESRLYFGGWDGKFFCLDAETGTRKWIYDARSAVIGSAVVEGGKCYFGTDSGTLICLDSVDGSLIWERYASKSFPASPSFDGTKLFFGSKDSNLYAIDSVTGSTIWTFKTGDEILSTPAMCDGNLYFGSSDKRFYCIEQTRGQRQWDFAADSKIVAAAACWTNRIVFPTKAGKLYCLDKNGVEVWVIDLHMPCSSSPTVADGIIYLSTEDGTLWSIKAATGEIIWNQKVSSKFTTTPVVTNGYVLCGGYDLNMYSFVAAVDCLEVSPPMLDFYSVERWAKDQRVVQLINCGENDLDLTITTDAKWFKLLPARVVLPPRQKIRLVVELVSGQLNDPGTSLRADIKIDYVKNATILPVRCFVRSDKIKTKCEWTSFGGNPARTSETEEGCGPKPGKLEQIWEFKAKFPICSSSASSNGKLYFGSYDSNVYCVDAHTGDEIWTFPTNGYVLSTPCVSYGKAYVGSGDGRLYCLDSETGEKIWTYKTFGKIDSSPVAQDGKLFFGSDEGSLYCIDAYTGKHKWMFHASRSIQGTPALSQTKAVFSSSNGYLYCLDIETGKLVWQSKTGGRYSSPCIWGTKIFIGSSDNNLHCINIDSGKTLWSLKTMSGYSSPAMMGNKVVIGSDNGKLYCVNTETGKSTWVAQLSGVLTSPAVNGKTIRIASSEGTIFSIDGDGKVIDKFVIPSAVFGSPSIADGQVYIGSFNGRMYCLGGPKQE